MCNKMKVKVTPENDVPHRYTVEFDAKCAKKECKPAAWLGRRVGKIAILALIVLCLGFSKRVFEAMFCLKSAEKNTPRLCEQIFYSNSNGCSGDFDCSSTQTENCTKTEEKITAENFTSTTKVRTNLYQILGMVFTMCLAVTLISLATLLIRDESTIRYEKLDLLREAKESLLDTLDYNDKNTETKKTAKKCDESDEEKSFKTATTSESSIKEALVKQYLSRIAEI